MKKLYKMLPLFVAGLLLFSGASLFAEEKEGSKSDLKKYSAVTVSHDRTNRTLVNVGQVAMWIDAQGLSANVPATGGSGLFFPRGSNPSTAAIFQDQLVWGGLVIDGAEPVLRVGGGQYAVGHVAGKILSKGVPEDRTDPNINRIWRVRRDFVTAELRQDAAELNNILAAGVSQAQMDVVRDTYRRDWIDWPASRGAPFYDADGDGQYNPAFNADGSPMLFPDADEPGVADADQVVWLVTNDLNPGALANFSGSPSIGIEQQITLWAYARADELGQIVFKQFRFIYKGTLTAPPTARIDSMYVTQWSDPDVGDAGDDLAGSDIGLSLGYAYNSNAVDSRYADVGLPPPASGYDFFAGPLVDSPGAEGIFGLKKVTDRANLPMTAFASFSAGTQASDPGPLGSYDVTEQWYNMQRCFLPRPISPPTPFLDQSGNPTCFTLAGNPVSGVGDVDFGQGDRRILLTSGPFQMALGDTNEVVIAAMAAIGSDRLSSVSVLKFVDNFAQEAFDNLFQLPKPPAAPIVTATELDGQIFLEWGSAGKLDRIKETEGHNNLGHVFEGYNIYQLASAGQTPTNADRLGTFDLINGVLTIFQNQFDVTTGQVLNLPVKFGSDSGISRTFTIRKDITRNLPLINGQTYFFGVSAYTKNQDPNASTQTLESVATVVTVVPETFKPGERTQSVAGDVLPFEHLGPSDGAVTVIVTDETVLTGDSYQVTFRVDTTLGNVWDLQNTTTGEMLLTGQTNQTGDDTYILTEGFQTVVTGAPQGFKSFQIVANAAGPIDPPGAWGFDFQGFPTPGAANPDAANQASGQRWAFHAGGGGGSYSAFLGRSLRGDNFDRVVPFDWEMRFTARGSWSSHDFTTGALEKVPFELWNIGVGTPDDPSDDYRLIPWFLELSAVGGVDVPDASYGLTANDHPGSGGSDDPFTPWIYWRIPVDNSPGEAGYNQYVTDIDTTDLTNYGTYDELSPEAFARSVLVCWNCDDVGDGSLDPAVERVPEQGTVFRIITTKPNTSADTFTFTTAGFEPTASSAQAREDVLKLVNVFPNPYLGVNSFEGNRFNRFMTFSHLPEKATIRIFNLAGVLVRTLLKDDPSQFTNWDLLNEEKLPVASGLYIANIEMPDLGVSKNLKLAIVQEQQFLRRF